LFQAQLPKPETKAAETKEEPVETATVPVPTAEETPAAHAEPVAETEPVTAENAAPTESKMTIHVPMVAHCYQPIKLSPN
jgi:hypothetical protein